MGRCMREKKKSFQQKEEISPHPSWNLQSEKTFFLPAASK